MQTQQSLPLVCRCFGKCTDAVGARAMLGLQYHELAPLVESGRISWAINIASAASERAELRFPTICINNCRSWIEGNLTKVPDFTAAEIARYLFGSPLASDLCPLTSCLIRASAFYDALNMKPSHTYALVADGSLRLARGSTRRRGPGGSAIITWLDAIQFLTTHRFV
jgi:hypothetical protein